MKTYRTIARRWEHGWELHVRGVGVTQVRTLDHAVRQACDLIETMKGSTVDEAAIDLVLELDGLEDEAAQARRQVEEAEALRSTAATAVRKVAADLRQAGLSVTDIATVLGVSRGRVSQYLAPTAGPRPQRA